MKISRKERKENRKNRKENRKGLIINSLRTLSDSVCRSTIKAGGQVGLRKKTLRPLREPRRAQRSYTFFPKYLNIYIINCLSSYKILFYILVFLLGTSCGKDEKNIEYQAGYPNVLAGNWIAFEFKDGNLEGEISEPYDLVTSLDPNREGYIILDKMYASDVRVRAKYDTTSFKVVMGEQLEVISSENYNIAYISVDGYVTSEPILVNFLYLLANAYYENIAFRASDIKDVIIMHAGFYDEYNYPVDTVLIMGYRKTGFEDVSY
jgi:hypothetical protein